MVKITIFGYGSVEVVPSIDGLALISIKLIAMTSSCDKNLYFNDKKPQVKMQGLSNYWDFVEAVIRRDDDMMCRFLNAEVE